MLLPLLEDNHEYEIDVTSEQYPVLKSIGNRTLEDLLGGEKSDLLVFPYSLGANGDGIGGLRVFSLHEKKITTGNLVGFCGKGNTDIHILSRFDSDVHHQYFLHYMLQKVLGINIIKFDTGIDDDNIWDFLLYLFPFCLKKAMRQGLFRTYRTFRYNNDKVKGTIDIPAHIQQNIPFAGKVAYQTREHTANNHLIHLVRHTIEAIRRHPWAGQLLTNDQETRQYVEAITIVTPDFNPHELNKVMQKNLRPVRHPFYTEYTPLQQLCIKILRHECLTYGDDDDKIHGILFDASWLWEEYLAIVLARIGFIHHVRGMNPISFYDNDNLAIPDFTNEQYKIVIDAKYKPLLKRLRTNDLREDRFQLISYMHIQTAKIGLLMYPTSSNSQQPQWEGTLRGFGGNVGIYGFDIPDSSAPVDASQNKKNFSEFSTEMDSMGDSIARWLQDYARSLISP